MTNRWRYGGRAEALCEYLRKNAEWLLDPEASELLLETMLHNFDSVFALGLEAAAPTEELVSDKIPVLDLTEACAGAERRVDTEERSVLPPAWINVAKS